MEERLSQVEIPELNFENMVEREKKPFLFKNEASDEQKVKMRELEEKMELAEL